MTPSCKNMDANKLSIAERQYFLRCQVDTPEEIIQRIWKHLKFYRSSFDKVVDLGAGDGRFSRYGKYNKYCGYEVDSNKLRNNDLPSNASLNNRCAFSIENDDYDLCIGNPPYIRHHHLHDTWREHISQVITKRTGIKMDHRANAYLYFLFQALLLTKENGLVALVVPFEWVVRPAANPLRSFIEKNKWRVDTYRFTDAIFPRVLTTASLTIIDKKKDDNQWHFFQIDRSFNVKRMRYASGNKGNVLSYNKREADGYYALRGMSPGTQKVFTLTEGERISYGLEKEKDVVPCVTTLKMVPNTLRALNSKAFEKHYVDKGAKCWLINTSANPSVRLQEYLDGIPVTLRSTATCINRDQWWRFSLHPVPRILFNSGFVKHGPKFLENKVGAYAVGSVCGIHGKGVIRLRELLNMLRSYSFEKRVVRHAGALMKVEINQMNHVLSALKKRRTS